MPVVSILCAICEMRGLCRAASLTIQGGGISPVGCEMLWSEGLGVLRTSSHSQVEGVGISRAGSTGVLLFTFNALPIV